MCATLGPVGAPKASSAFGFCTYGPGTPASCTTSGAASATTTSSTMKPSESERHAVAAQTQPEQPPRRAPGERPTGGPPPTGVEPARGVPAVASTQRGIGHEDVGGPGGHTTATRTGESVFLM